MTRISFLLLSLWLPTLAAQAKPRHYELDPVHSRLVFLVQHAGFSRAIGTFSGITGTLRFDPDDPAGAHVEAEIPIASLDLGDAKWRKSVLDPTFFNEKKYPTARFVSTRVEVRDAGALQITGELDLHGIKREVQLEAQLNKLDRHPLTLRTTAGFSAHTQLHRAAFGMDSWKKLVSDEVEVMIEIEATRRRAAKDEKDAN